MVGDGWRGKEWRCLVEVEAEGHVVFVVLSDAIGQGNEVVMMTRSSSILEFEVESDFRSGRSGEIGERGDTWVRPWSWREG